MEIVYGNRTIEFELTLSDRRTLEISVLPDQSVRVKAPENKPLDEIIQRVKRRGSWILKQQSYFSKFPDSGLKKEYVSGETFRYLGRQYRLKVIDLAAKANGEELLHRDEVKLVGKYFRVFSNQSKNPVYTKKLLENWYRIHAVNKFQERLDLCARIMQKYGVEKPPLEVRKMKSRWGSCTPAGKILLNPRLIETPVYCIDYVILHELCHLKHPHHGKEFYRLLSLVLPEWEQIKGRLENLSRN